MDTITSQAISLARISNLNLKTYFDHSFVFKLKTLEVEFNWLLETLTCTHYMCIKIFSFSHFPSFKLNWRNIHMLSREMCGPINRQLRITKRERHTGCSLNFVFLWKILKYIPDSGLSQFPLGVHNDKSTTGAAAVVGEFRKITTF